MRFIARLIVPLSVGLLTTLAPVDLALAQEVPTADTMLGNLSGLQAPSDLEVPALRLQAADRVKSRSDALKRPLLVPQLNRLPHVNVDIQFNPDSPVIRPESYRTIARIADVLTTPALMSSVFLIVGRVESNGARRDNNLMLSQRRAESIRDALVTTYKVSAKWVFAVGLGEEQLVDANNPKAAVNQQSMIVTLREIEPVAGGGSVKPPDASHAKKSRKAGK